MKAIILIFFISFFSSCGIFDENNTIVRTLPTIQINSLSSSDKNLSAIFTIETSNSCQEYYLSEIQNNDSECIIKPYGKEDGNAMCSTVMGSLTINETIRFQTSGQKILKFYVNESQYIDTLIIVN